MLPLKLSGNNEGLKILCLGAHCDDIEIGCGGTLLRLINEYPIKNIKWVIFTSSQERASETRKSAEAFLRDVKQKEIVIKDFRDGFLFDKVKEVKEMVEELKGDQPDLIFTHYRADRHQDHRLLSDLTWNTFRNHLILEYEIPKYDGDLGNPNFFVRLSKQEADNKCKFIINSYLSQKSKHWFDQEMFSALMRIRAMECASETNYAEAFYTRKTYL